MWHHCGKYRVSRGFVEDRQARYRKRAGETGGRWSIESLFRADARQVPRSCLVAGRGAADGRGGVTVVDAKR